MTTVAGSMLVLAPLTAAAEPRQTVGTASITQVADDPVPETEKELRAAIQAILDDPEVGVGVRREALEALEIGTVEAMTYFFETGWQFGQDEDNRFAIFVILADPDTGRAVRDAAGVALEDGSSEALVYFLETGRWIAQDEDNRFAIFVILADPDTGRAVRDAAGVALE
ncbi:hypothetical protein, partial [Promicromonospora sukumoe]|uniref:hypothetical protein n=1 Tax=Promicromonospora sukumoe TaxID=88382 RepID=UPI0036587AE7